MKKKLISLSVALVMLMQFAFPVLATETKKTNSANAENAAQKLSDATPAEAASANVKSGTKDENVSYDKEGEYNNLKYGIKDGEVTITGYVSQPLGEIVIPETIEGYPVTGIGDYAFSNCSLTSVTMSNVQTIGKCAFEECSSLTSVEMPSVQKIYGFAFCTCYNLTSVKMPNVQTIGKSAFGYCNSLTSVEMPNVKEAAGNSFTCTPWYDNLKDEFTVFGDGVLVKYCGTAKEVTVPDNVKCVAGFYDNDNITSVEMLNVQTIGAYALYNCDSLESVEMPNVQTIDEWAFASCISITSVKMPNVQTIGNHAFYYSYSLTSVEMPNVETIGNGAFNDCSKLTSFIISSDNNYYSADGGILYNKDKTTLFAYPSATGDIKIADSVQTIGEYAFYSCDSLTSVEMPNVQTIGEYAFYSCDSLTSVEMPNVQVIGHYTFYDCQSLTSVEILNVQTIGGWAFWRCSSLTRLEMPNVQTIGDEAFKYCGLTSVKMPDVQMVGEAAFFGCESLKKVEMLNVQRIDAYAFTNCYNLECAYFYSDAPTEFGNKVFDSCAVNFTIYYAKGTSGWTTPTWNGYPTQEFDPTSYHSVTFIDGLTGETISTATVKHGKDVTLPTSPEHDGYTFTGWDSDGKNITADTIITALYEKNSIITFTIGDINGDGKINTADAVYLLKSAAGMLELTSEQMLVADLNHDGKINTADAVMILRYVAGIITLD